MFYLTITPVLILSLCMIVYLRDMKKHDHVLYKVCQVRRDSMCYLRENWENLDKTDYIALRRLVEALNMVISNYNDHKTILFNLRKFKNFIREYKSFSKEVESIPTPQNEEIKIIYNSAWIAFFSGFFAYTPLIRSEVAMRAILLITTILSKLGVRYINNSARQTIETISNIKKQAHNYGVT